MHRHQDEIAQLQQRRDIDIPQLALQDVKQRHWMVERRSHSPFFLYTRPATCIQLLSPLRFARAHRNPDSHSYKYFYAMASADGFKAFYLEWQRARTERAKWNKASAHAARMYTRKGHAVWFDYWMERRRNRHLENFSLRNIRRNRCNRAFGIWCGTHPI